MPTRAQADEFTVSLEDRAAVNLGIELIEHVYNGQCLALLMVDRKGTYFSFAPGREREVAKWLCTVDFDPLRRSVEEHFR